MIRLDILPGSGWFWFGTKPEQLFSVENSSSGRPNIVPVRIKWWKKWIEYSGGTLFYKNFLSSTVGGKFHDRPE